MDDEQYQEDVLVRRLDTIYLEISEWIDNLGDIVSNHGSMLRAGPIFNRLKVLINEFEPKPKLLDNQLGNYIPELTRQFLSLAEPSPLRRGICEIIYCFSKIRGFKFISNYFSSDIYIMDRLIAMIGDCDDGNNDDNEVFTCLIWLSNLVLIPFRLHDIDPDLMVRLYQIGLLHLKVHTNASKNQIVSSIILSRLLTRSDASDLLHTYLYDQIELEWKSNSLDSTARLGHLITLNKILKRTSVSNKELTMIYDLVSLDLLRLQKDINSLNNTNILYLIKILSKLSIRFVDDYNQILLIINNLLNDVMNLLMNKTFDIKLRYEIAKSLSEINLSLSKKAINYQSQLNMYLLNLLDVDLTKDEVEIIDDKILIPKYHTILLFLGYISLNKSLPIELIPLVLKIIHRTLFVEQRRFQTVLGNQVRDSSCFIIWSICRTLNVKQFKQYQSQLAFVFFDLIKVIIFDNDLIVRKCGLAVLQEFIGRFGQHIFIHCQDLDERGEYIINFIEMFDNINKPLDLIQPLIKKGNLSKNLFIEVLIKKICDNNNSFKLRKQLSHYLKQILSISSNEGIDFGIHPLQYTTGQVIERLIKENASIYTICEIISEDNDVEYYQYLEEIYVNCKFDHHRDTVQDAEGYLMLVNALTKLKPTLFEFNKWDTFLEITRVQSCDINQFEIFFQRLKTAIPDNVFKSILHHITNSSIILSQTVFNYQCWTNNELDQLIRIIENTRIDSDIRSNLLTNLMNNFNLVNRNEDISNRLIELLDDYTITNQGDVGSKIRFRVLKLINCNYECFSELHDSIELKAIRLVGELMDNIRIGAFKLILRKHGTIIKDTSFDVSNSFFEQLFKFFHDYILIPGKLDLIEQFLIGISFTVGAIVANKEITHKSYIEFLKFLHSLSESYQEKILDIYLNNLLVQHKSSPERQLKGQVMILNLVKRLFESNYQFPSNFKYDKLYIGCYNLHINTTNFNRIQIPVKIFQYILEQPSSQDLKIKVINRIIWLSCQHRIPKIRRFIGEEVLFEINQNFYGDDIATELKNQEIIDSIQWDHDSPQALKKNISLLQQMFLKH